MNEFHGIGIYDRPKRKKTSPLRIERHNNGQGEKTHFIKRERESNGQGERNHFNKRERMRAPPRCVIT
jgi:hypothetical protein